MKKLTAMSVTTQEGEFARHEKHSIDNVDFKDGFYLLFKGGNQIADYNSKHVIKTFYYYEGDDE